MAFQLEKEELKLFPSLSMHWEHPGYIENAILDFNHQSIYDAKKVIDQLEELGCKRIQLRFYNDCNIETIATICSYCNEHRIRLIEIIAPYKKYTTKQWASFFKAYPRVIQWYAYNAPFNKAHQSKQYIPVIFTTQNITSHSHCGNINLAGFTVTQGLFIESQKHNSCLNHKISIDVSGNIKNCPSMQKSYGNIKDTTLEQALNKKGFRATWYIDKKQISICKQCEFRYMCIDCRAFVEDPKDIYSKPLKCGYNPKTMEWEDWSTNPLKQEALKFYKISQ